MTTLELQWLADIRKKMGQAISDLMHQRKQGDTKLLATINLLDDIDWSLRDLMDDTHSKED